MIMLIVAIIVIACVLASGPARRYERDRRALIEALMRTDPGR